MYMRMRRIRWGGLIRLGWLEFIETLLIMELQTIQLRVERHQMDKLHWITLLKSKNHRLEELELTLKITS